MFNELINEFHFRIRKKIAKWKKILCLHCIRFNSIFKLISHKWRNENTLCSDVVSHSARFGFSSLHRIHLVQCFCIFQFIFLHSTIGSLVIRCDEACWYASFSPIRRVKPICMCIILWFKWNEWICTMHEEWII